MIFGFLHNQIVLNFKEFQILIFLIKWLFHVRIPKMIKLLNSSSDLTDLILGYYISYALRVSKISFDQLKSTNVVFERQHGVGYLHILQIAK